MNLSFIPRARIAEHLEAGWRPALRDEEYQRAEYAVLMVLPADPVPATASLVKSFTRIFAQPTHDPARSNALRASLWARSVQAGLPHTERFHDLKGRFAKASWLEAAE